MERAAVQRRLSWLVAEVVATIEETTRARSIVLDCPGWPGHLPGQHLDLRLTAPDGYQAQRSYSIATPPDGERVTITVELVGGGEVSPFLVGELRVGDRIEVRGPIGGYFVWEPGGGGGPLQLIAGGSGVVPLMAMVRARARAAPGSGQVRLLVSARTIDDVLYRSELEALDLSDWLEVTTTLTRAQPAGWTGPARRVDRAMLETSAWGSSAAPQCFVCGPTGFVEAASSLLVELGHEPGSIKTERFGPTGG